MKDKKKNLFTARWHGHVLVGVLTSLALLPLAIAPASAEASFTRPFLRQITGPFHGLEGGVAVDGSDNLWLSGGPAGGGKPFSLNEFKPASEQNLFGQTLEIEGLNPPETGFSVPSSLAIAQLSGAFYVDGMTPSVHAGSIESFDPSGVFNGRFGSESGSGKPQMLAVDNSERPSNGTIYVARQARTDMPGGIAKFNATGEPVDFSEAGNGLSYVSGNEITGYEGATSPFKNPNPGPLGVAVDNGGRIYTIVHGYTNNADAVVVYAASGKFIRAILGPGANTGGEEKGFGGEPQSLTIDPSNGDLLVSVTRYGGSFAEPLAGHVDEFDATGRFVGQVFETSGGQRPQSAYGLAADSAGNVYLLDSASGMVDAFGPGHFVPGLRIGEAEQATPTTAVLSGEVNAEAAVNPEHAGLTACEFEYVSEAAYESTGFTDLSSGGEAPCEPDAGAIPADEEFHPVHAAIGGLESGRAYVYRLSGTLGGAKGGLSAHTAAAAFTAPHAPRVDSISADNLSSTFADLHATIDPLGAASSYRFQYLTAAEFAANGESFEGPDQPVEVPASPVGIGSGGANGSTAVEVEQHAAGLNPGTAYRLRVVAENSVGSTEAETTFSTLPAIALGLPDNRGYELVTPPDKGSAEDMFGEPQTNGEFFNAHNIGISSSSGDRFLLEANAAFGSSPASSLNAYVFSREPANGQWGFTPLASPEFGLQNLVANSVLFDPADFSRVAFIDSIGSSASEAGSRNSSLVGPPGGPYQTLATDSPQRIGEVKAQETEIGGGSADLSRLVIQSSNVALVPGGPAEVQDPVSRALFAYAGGALSTVNVRSNGKLLSRCGAVLGGGSVYGRGITRLGATNEGQSLHAVSNDGFRVFFTSPDPQAVNGGSGCWDGASSNPPQLYLREGAETLEISVPSPFAPEASPGSPSEYVGAAADGSRVYFLSRGWLTPDHPGVHDLELYEWRTPGTAGAAGSGSEAGPCEESSPSWVPASHGCLTRVSAGESGGAGAVWSVPAVSSSGAAVYLAADGVLASNRGADGSFAEPGECKDSSSFTGCALYRYDSAAGTTTYVASVNNLDFPSAGTGCLNDCPIANWHTNSNGRYLFFGTNRPLTGYSTVSAHPGQECATLPSAGGQGNDHCSELYRYDSAAAPGQQLVCVSCNPSGAPPVSNAQFARSGGTNKPQARSVLSLSEDGTKAFFDTADALVPNDVNGSLDVYEWEAGGSGSCHVEEGCISLLSSGRDSGPSYFLGASPDGSNVFIGTHSRLVPADTDTEGDVYDARICTGEDPCIQPAPAKEGLCEGDACSHPVPAPNDETPGSLTFQGAGNVKGAAPPAKCGHGKVRRHGRCVKRKRHRAHRRVNPNQGGKK